jgi:hypothetical protein
VPRGQGLPFAPRANGQRPCCRLFISRDAGRRKAFRAAVSAVKTECCSPTTAISDVRELLTYRDTGHIAARIRNLPQELTAALPMPNWRAMAAGFTPV